MAITLPEHLREVLDVLGFHFPAINEDILDEHALAWKAFADELEHIIGDADRAARMVADQNYGQAIDAFNGFWQSVGGQGDLRLAQEASQLVSGGLDIASDITVAAKTATIAQATAAAVSLGIGIAGAIVTGGISALIGLAASQGFRIALREIIQEATSRAAKSAVPKMRREAGDRLRGIWERCKRRVENFKTQARAKMDELGDKLGPDFAVAGGGKWPRHTKGPDPKTEGRMLSDSPGGSGGASRRSQWDDAEGGNNKPDPDRIYTTPERQEHILDGDPNDLESGGHRYGTGRPGKTEFPERWSDDKTIDYVEDVARQPDRPPSQLPDENWESYGQRDGVNIRTIVRPDGSIETAHPTSGNGVVRNDSQGRPHPKPF